MGSVTMEIKRDAYLQQLIEWKDNGMIKVITGIRRCGKSFLLFTIFKRYLLENGVDVDHIIEIALDGIENEELRDPKVCFKYIKDAMKDDGKYYLHLAVNHNRRDTQYDHEYLLFYEIQKNMEWEVKRFHW